MFPSHMPPQDARLAHEKACAPPSTYNHEKRPLAIALGLVNACWLSQAHHVCLPFENPADIPRVGMSGIFATLSDLLFFESQYISFVATRAASRAGFFFLFVCRLAGLSSVYLSPSPDLGIASYPTDNYTLLHRNRTAVLRPPASSCPMPLDLKRYDAANLRRALQRRKLAHRIHECLRELNQGKCRSHAERRRSDPLPLRMNVGHGSVSVAWRCTSRLLRNGLWWRCVHVDTFVDR